MPIFVLAVVALLIFLAMGLLLFSATVAEQRQRQKAASVAPGQPPEKPKARAAHA